MTQNNTFLMILKSQIDKNGVNPFCDETLHKKKCNVHTHILSIRTLARSYTCIRSYTFVHYAYITNLYRVAHTCAYTLTDTHKLTHTFKLLITIIYT